MAAADKPDQGKEVVNPKDAADKPASKPEGVDALRQEGLSGGVVKSDAQSTAKLHDMSISTDRSGSQLLKEFVGDGAPQSGSHFADVMKSMKPEEIPAFVKAYNEYAPGAAEANINFILDRTEMPAGTESAWTKAVAELKNPGDAGATAAAKAETSAPTDQTNLRSGEQLLKQFTGDGQSLPGSHFADVMKGMKPEEIPRFVQAYQAASPDVAASNIHFVLDRSEMPAGTEKIWNQALSDAGSGKAPDVVAKPAEAAEGSAEARQHALDDMVAKMPEALNSGDRAGIQQRSLEWLGQFASATEKGDLKYDAKAIDENLKKAGFDSSMTALDATANDAHMGKFLIAQAMNSLESGKPLPANFSKTVGDYFAPATKAELPTESFHFTDMNSGLKPEEVKAAAFTAQIAKEQIGKVSDPAVAEQLKGMWIGRNGSSMADVAAGHDANPAQTVKEWNDGVNKLVESKKLDWSQGTDLEVKTNSAYAPLDASKPGFTSANPEAWEKVVKGGFSTGYGADMDVAMLNHVADANKMMQDAVDAAKESGKPISSKTLTGIMDDTDKLGDSGSSRSMANRLVIATAREDVGRAYLKALQDQSTNEGFKKMPYEDYVKTFDGKYGGTRTQDGPAASSRVEGPVKFRDSSGDVQEMTRQPDGSYKMEVGLGSNFSGTAATAIEQAKVRDADVTFNFNGAEVKANGKSTVDELTTQFHQELDRRAEAYRSSPEGIQAAKEQAAEDAQHDAAKTSLEAQYGKFSDRPDLSKLQFTPANPEALAALVKKADSGTMSGYGKDLDYAMLNHANIVDSELQKIADKSGVAALTPDAVNKVFNDTDMVGHSGFSASMAQNYAIANAREDVGRAMFKAFNPDSKVSYDNFVKTFDTKFGGTRELSAAEAAPAPAPIESIKSPGGDNFKVQAQPDGSYKMAITGGARLDDVSAAAIEQAAQRKADVSFKFNGVDVTANATSTVEGLSKAYDAEQTRKSAEYRNSPEGIKAAKEQADDAAARSAQRTALESQYGKFTDRPDISKAQFTSANPEGLANLVKKADAGNLTGYGKDLDYAIINHSDVVSSELQKIADKSGAAALTPDVINKVFNDTDVVGHSGMSASLAESYIAATAREDVGRAVFKALKMGGTYENLASGFDKTFGGTREVASGTGPVSIRDGKLASDLDGFDLAKQPDGSIKMDGYYGNISNAERLAIGLAKDQNAPVKFDFNGVDLTAKPDAKSGDIQADFTKQLDAKREAYRSSPEGIAAAEKRTQEIAETQGKVDELIKTLPDVLKSDDVNAPNGKVVDWVSKFCDLNDDVGVKMTPDQRQEMVKQFEAAGWKADARVGDPAASTDAKAFAQWGVGQAVSQLKDGNVSPNMAGFIESGYSKLVNQASDAPSAAVSVRDAALADQLKRFDLEKQTDGSIKMDGYYGDISNAERLALGLAKDQNAEVKLNFNGVELSANPNSKAGDIANYYDKKLDAKREAYINSPEGKLAEQQRVTDVAERQSKVDQLAKSLPDVLKSDNPNAPNGKVIDWVNQFGDASDRTGVNVTPEQRQQMVKQFEDAGWKAGARVGDPAAKTDLAAMAQWGVGQAVKQIESNGSVSSNMSGFVADNFKEMAKAAADAPAKTAAVERANDDPHAPLDASKPGFDGANAQAWKNLVEKAAAGEGPTGYGADMDNAMLKHVADANKALEAAAAAAKNGGPKLSWDSMEKILDDTDKLGDSGASHALTRALVIATAREDVGKAYYKAMQDQSTDKAFKAKPYEDYVKTFDQKYGGSREAAPAEAQAPRERGGLDTVAKADVSKAVEDFGQQIGNDAASKHAFLSAVGDDRAMAKLLDSTTKEEDRRALEDLRDKVRGMSPDELKLFRENLLSDSPQARGGMDTLGKVGLLGGLGVAISTAIYFAHQQYQKESKPANRVPSFTSD